MNSRLIKLLFSCAVASYISLVSFNNISDYSSNFPFVAAVAEMTDTFSITRNGWRAINQPLLHHLFFILIVAWEISIAIFMWAGSFKMLRNLTGPAINFKVAKRFTRIGLSLGVLLWFVVFISIGGEWFLMWQSKNWNAQPTAFNLTCCFLLFLIHHNQQDV